MSSIDRMRAELKSQQEKQTSELECKIAIVERVYPILQEHGIEEPKYIHITTLYGAAASLAYDDVQPDEILRMMDAFPPIELQKVKGSGTVGFRPVTAPDKIREGDKVESAGFHMLRLDKSPNSGPTRAEVRWYTQIADDLVIEIDARPLQVWGVLPEITAKVNRVADIITSLECVRVVFPIEAKAMLFEQRYAAVDAKHYNPFVFTGQVAVLVQAWAAECLRRETASWEAYERAKAACIGIPDVIYDPDDSSAYDREPLQAGTLKQWKALHTPAAKADYEVAGKHWRMYCKDHGITSSAPSYSSHYDWACHWLAERGLHPDPDGPDGKPYKYGSAWLKGGEK